MCAGMMAMTKPAATPAEGLSDACGGGPRAPGPASMVSSTRNRVATPPQWESSLKRSRTWPNQAGVNTSASTYRLSGDGQSMSEPYSQVAQTSFKLIDDT